MIPILQIENRDTEIRINLSYTAKLPQVAELVSTPWRPGPRACALDRFAVLCMKKSQSSLKQTTSMHPAWLASPSFYLTVWQSSSRRMGYTGHIEGRERQTGAQSLRFSSMIFSTLFSKCLRHAICINEYLENSPRIKWTDFRKGQNKCRQTSG